MGKREASEISIVLVGDIIDGIEPYGPFPDGSTARAWAEAHFCDGCFHVVTGLSDPGVACEATARPMEKPGTCSSCDVQFDPEGWPVGVWR